MKHIEATAAKYALKCEKYMKAHCMKSVCHQNLQAPSLEVIALIRVIFMRKIETFHPV